MVSEEQLAAAVKSYHENGFGIIEDFFNDEEVEQIKEASRKIANGQARRKGDVLEEDEMWRYPERNKRYLACADGKTRCFFEPTAVDPKSNKLLVDPVDGLCKMGFSLHNYDPFFKKLVQSRKVCDTFRALDFVNPILIQTMVNFKNPKVGGEFIPHQDASYLTTTDPRYLVGLWWALDDATVENGCLDVIPGSHKWNLNRTYIKCPGGEKPDGTMLEWTGPMAIYDKSMYIKVPAKRGSLVFIHGLLLHKSDPNRTDKSRWAFVLHAFDKARCDYVDGWLPSTCKAFMPVFAN